MNNRKVLSSTGGGGSHLSGCEAPAPVRVSETGSASERSAKGESPKTRFPRVEQERARNWTMPPLRQRREPSEHTKFATALLLKILSGGRYVKPCVDETANAAFGNAFTMAEILLSLTIIGVVAAITLPSLTGNINERTWNTQRKALYSRFSQAVALMPALNGYGILTEGDSSTSAVDTAAETFVTDGLAKVLKINNICDSDHLEDCGIPDKLTTLFGTTVSSIPKTLVEFNELFDGSWNSGGIDYSYSQLDTKAAAFETQNGESILTFYNPYCRYETTALSWYSTQPEMCANFIYDLNGKKGPNTFGKDIGFITVLYPSDPVVVAPIPLAGEAEGGAQYDAMKACKKFNVESRLPNKEELAAIFYNKNFVGLTSGYYWSSTSYSTDQAWVILMHQGTLHRNGKEQGRGVRCVKL